MKKAEKKQIFCITQEPAVIAVVGKMASGKNFICSQFEKYGWKSIDADSLVHKAIEQKSEKIIETFSKDALNRGLKIQNEDGSINRRELGKLLFENEKFLAMQEQIVYPVITKMIQEFISTNPNVIINATVLYKTPDILKLCKKIYYVKASFFKRLKRAHVRDGLPYNQILKRFNAQKNLYNEYKKSGLPVQIIRN